MRHLWKALLAGAAIIGGAAFVSQAALAHPTIHKMTVALPGGGSEMIEYTGIQPKVTISQTPLYAAPFFTAWPMPITFGAFAPGNFGAFAPGLDFAAFNHWAVHLNRQMNVFWHQAWSGQGVPMQTALKNPGPGSLAYSVVSSSSGNNFCARMTSITTPVDGGKPKIVSRTSGNCGAPHAQAHNTANAAPLGVGTWHFLDGARLHGEVYTNSSGPHAPNAHAPGITSVALRTQPDAHAAF